MRKITKCSLQSEQSVLKYVLFQNLPSRLKEKCKKKEIQPQEWQKEAWGRGVVQDSAASAALGHRSCPGSLNPRTLPSAPCGTQLIAWHPAHPAGCFSQTSPVTRWCPARCVRASVWEGLQSTRGHSTHGITIPQPCPGQGVLWGWVVRPAWHKAQQGQGFGHPGSPQARPHLG